jgi:enoyl-CoA hydratase/carnithine racemase
LPTYETLLYEEEDGVAVVTLNRPEVHNAFDQQMQAELRTLWQSLRTNDDVRVVILTGAGDKAFCTGIDRAESIEQGYLTDEADRPRMDSWTGPVSTPFQYNDPGININPKENDLWKPVIAAVNGMACAGAFYILGEVDIIIAAEHATFFDPHVTYGMPAAFEPIFLLHKMPFGEVVRLALLGAHERLSARRAYEVGLVSQVVPKEELPEQAAWAAGVIAGQPALAVQGTLRALWTGLELSRRQALDHAFLFTNIGTDAASLAEGQAQFSSGQRIDWHLR